MLQMVICELHGIGTGVPSSLDVPWTLFYPPPGGVLLLTACLLPSGPVSSFPREASHVARRLVYAESTVCPCLGCKYAVLVCVLGWK
jgi:hypothetical protein